MSFWSKVGNVLKKVAAPVAGLAATAFGGPALGAAVGGISGLFSSKSAARSDAPSTDQQVNIEGKRPPSIPWGDMATAAISGGLNYLGAKQTNAANAKMAQQQMDFQEQMSSTSYQRATADMLASGINPMLAYQQGGASAPSGASAQMSNALGEGANSALSTIQTLQQLRNMMETNEQLSAQTELVQAQKRYTNAQTITEGFRPESVQADTKYSLANTRNRELDAQYQVLKNRLFAETFEAQKSEISSSSDLRRYQAMLERLGISKASAYSDFYGTKIGKEAPLIEFGVNNASSVLDALLKGKRIGARR